MSQATIQMLSHSVQGLEEHDKGCKCQLCLMEFRVEDFYYHLHWNLINMNKWTALTTTSKLGKCLSFGLKAFLVLCEKIHILFNVPIKF